MMLFFTGVHIHFSTNRKITLTSKSLSNPADTRLRFFSSAIEKRQLLVIIIVDLVQTCKTIMKSRNCHFEMICRLKIPRSGEIMYDDGKLGMSPADIKKDAARKLGISAYDADILYKVWK